MILTVKPEGARGELKCIAISVHSVETDNNSRQPFAFVARL